MNFDFNDEQREIKSTARDFLASRFKPEKVRELAESDSPYDDALWKEICDLGWTGIAIAEEHGGQAAPGVRVVRLLALHPAQHRRPVRPVGQLPADGLPQVLLVLAVQQGGVRGHRGRSFQGTSLSTRISPGRPSTRSATMFFKISDVPPSMEFARERRKR